MATDWVGALDSYLMAYASDWLLSSSGLDSYPVACWQGNWLNMYPEKLDQLILQMENYVECCKQFNHYVNLARIKKFDEEDENQFLEIKSV